MLCSCFFFFKQKTADEMRISDWSSDVCSSDLTSVVFEQSGGVFSVLPNDTLGKVLDASLRATGGVDYDADDTHFATALQQTLESPPPLAMAADNGNYSSDTPEEIRVGKEDAKTS